MPLKSLLCCIVALGTIEAIGQVNPECRVIVPASGFVAARTSFIPIGVFTGDEFDTPTGGAFTVLNPHSWAYSITWDIACTLDSGKTYTKMFRGLERGDTRQPARLIWYSPDTMIVGGSSLEAGPLLQITTDRGASWSDLPVPHNDKRLFLLEGNSTGVVVFEGVGDSVILVSSDRGSTWNRRRRAMLDGDETSFMYNCTVNEDGSIYGTFLTSSSWVLARSTDLGQSWETQPLECATNGRPYILPDSSILITTERPMDIDSNGVSVNARRMQTVYRLSSFSMAPSFAIQDTAYPFGMIRSLAFSRGMIAGGSLRLMNISTDLGRTWLADTTIKEIIENRGIPILNVRVQHPGVFLAIMSGVDSVVVFDYSFLLDPTSVEELREPDPTDPVLIYDLTGRLVATVSSQEFRSQERVRQSIRHTVGRGAFIAVTVRRTELLLIE